MSEASGKAEHLEYLAESPTTQSGESRTAKLPESAGVRPDEPLHDWLKQTETDPRAGVRQNLSACASQRIAMMTTTPDAATTMMNRIHRSSSTSSEHAVTATAMMGCSAPPRRIDRIVSAGAMYPALCATS